MIDLKTGIVEFNGIVIEPHCMIKDFEKYGPDKVKIQDCGDGRAIISLKKWVNSNRINADVYLEINEKANRRDVFITPISRKDLLTASKLWLKEMTINGDYEEREYSIGGNYDWGYIYARYRNDRDYGVTGGEIVISYTILTK